MSKSYLFVDVSTEEKVELQKARIDYYEFDDTLREAKGVIIAEQDKAKALVLFNSIERLVVRSSFEGILLLYRRKRAPRVSATRSICEVSVEEWDGSRQAAYTKIVQEVCMPELFDRVVLHVPHGSSHPPLNDGKFHIFVWSGLERSAVRKGPLTLWGMEVPCTDRGFRTSGTGIPVKDHQGEPVGELVGDNLYIFHDAVHTGSTVEQSIFRKILEEAVIVHLGSNISEEERSEFRTLMKSRFVKHTSHRIREHAGDLETSKKDVETKIQAYQQELITLIRREDELSHQIREINSRQATALEKFGMEFDALRSIPKVKDVYVFGNTISVFTNLLLCRNPNTGSMREIGEMRIDLYIDGTQNGMRIFNLTRQVNAYEEGMQAPHVFPDGKPCLGSLKEVVPQLIGQHEFSTLAQLAISFVESVNLDDRAGEHINRWPPATVAKGKSL
jgi:hypothetical protein